MSNISLENPILLHKNSKETIICRWNQTIIAMNEIPQNMVLEVEANANVRVLLFGEHFTNHTFTVNQNADATTVTVYAFVLGEKQTSTSLALLCNIGGNENKATIFAVAVLADFANVHMDSIVTVEERAKNASVEVKQENILLGANAKVRGMPALNIKTDAATAKHAFKVEPISEVETFYMQSRWMSKTEADFLTIAGKLQKMLTIFEDTEQKGEFWADMQKRLQEFITNAFPHEWETEKRL